MSYSGIQGKVALVSGASGSIGSGTAEALARHGARLALTGRDGPKLEAAAQRCRAAGVADQDILIITGDVTNQEDVKNVVAKTVEKFGSLDIMVNCVGVIKPGIFITTKMEDFDTVFRTNMRGVFLLCKAAVPHLVASKGAIVNLSSFIGIRPAYEYFVYSMAEAALDQFTRALALEVGPKGVRVNSVNPGVVRGTEIWTREGGPMQGKTTSDLEKIQDGLKNMYPLRRIAEVSDVANAICFLCSENASFVHGIILPIDGGKILTSKVALPDKPHA